MSYEERRTDELAAHGEHQIENSLPEAVGDESDPTMHPAFKGARSESLGELLHDIGDELSLLAQKEVELAKTELRADVGAEIAAVKGMGAAAFLAILGVSMLLIALVFVLAPGVERWIVALIMGLVLLGAALISAYIGWSKHVTHPLDTTVDTLKEDVRWAKESFT